jgi:hypothetical protein
MLQMKNKIDFLFNNYQNNKMDVNNVGMLIHSFIVSEYKITNPYIIGLMSAIIIYITPKPNYFVTP